jgi:hypothetical protein
VRSENQIPFVERLGNEFEAAAGRHIASQRQQEVRHGWKWAIAVSAFVTVLVVVATVFSTSPAAAGVQVEQLGDEIVVRIVDLETDPQSVEAAIAESGLDVRVASVPVSPSLVGRFVSSTGTDSAPDLTPLDVDGDTFMGFVISDDFAGTLELRIGRKALPGEAYLANGSAFGPGEPLECSLLYGTKVAEAVPMLARLGLDTRWQAVTEDSDGTALIEADPDSIRNLYVTDAISLGPDKVLIFAASEPESPFASGLGDVEPECP